MKKQIMTLACILAFTLCAWTQKIYVNSNGERCAELYRSVTVMTTLGYSVTYRLDDTVNSSIKYLAKYHMLRISRVYIVVDGIDTDGMGWLKEWCACSREMQERKIEEWNATGKRVEVETLAVGGM